MHKKKSKNISQLRECCNDSLKKKKHTHMWERVYARECLSVCELVYVYVQAGERESTSERGRDIGLFCGYIGLFCRYIGLFYGIYRALLRI